MRRTILLSLATAALTLTAGCADNAASTAPALDPGAPPRFVTDFSSSTAPSGAHYRQGFGEPTCDQTDGALTLTCTGTQIGGVGNTNATVNVAVEYEATVQCRNRGGQIVEVKTHVTDAEAGGGTFAPRNGTLVVGTVTTEPEPTDATFEREADCPNGNWRGVILGDPRITGYTYTLTFAGYEEPAISFSGP